MIKSLLIKNYALIDHLEINFADGLTIISGETGAGKSILLGALSLVLGQRADTKSIKEGAAKCVIEAIFDISQYHLEPLFTEQEWEYDPTECTLRREILISGKSRAFLNDTPVALTDLKLIGEKLIDVHSQHRNLLLGETSFQLQTLDHLAKHQYLVEEYKEQYRTYIRLIREIEQLKKQAEQSRKEEDYLRFQYNQLKAINIQAGEQQPLEEELEILTHAEDIKESLFKVDNLLTAEQVGLLSQLKETIHTLANVSKLYPALHELLDRANSTYIELKDIASETHAINDNVEYNPDRLNWIQERLNTLYTLEQKHHVEDADQLLNLQYEIEQQIQSIENSGEDIKNKEKEIEKQKQQLQEKASKITEGRQKAAKEIRETLIPRLVALGMPNAVFSCEILPEKEFLATGKDNVTFLFSANKNQQLRPVADIASGGEISRLMLSIKALIAGKTALPTIIFDEIDTGISGEIADKMGEMMKEISQYMQVITITHLPQVAAKGKQHYFVYKEDDEKETLTKIKLLSKQDRIIELARLLSGSALSDAAIANARELLQDN